MKIYQMKTKINDYQYLEPSVDMDVLDSLMSNDNILTRCQSIIWPQIPPEMISTRPKLPRPDFWNYAPYFTLAMPLMIAEKVKQFLEEAGELLPFTYKSEPFCVLNVLKCVNYQVFPEETPGTLYKEYLEGRIPNGIFRDVRRSRLYVSEHDGNPANEFKAHVEQEQMTGLIFHEIWNSQP